MRHAFSHKGAVYFASADDRDEYVELCEALISDASLLKKKYGVTVTKTGVVEVLRVEHLKGFKIPPIRLEFTDPSGIDAFVDDHRLVLVGKNACVDHQSLMIARAEKNKKNEDDGLTIGEIHGLNQHDPWHKQRPEDNRVDLHDLVADRLSGINAPDVNDSEKPPVPVAKTGAARENENQGSSRSMADILGSLTGGDTDAAIDQAKAVVGLDSTDLRVDVQGSIKFYHKVEVVGKKVEDVATAKIDADGAKVSRNHLIGCWFAFIEEADAIAFEKQVTSHGFPLTRYVVDEYGERTTTDDVDFVYDPNADGDTAPRPWNHLAAKLAAMSADAKNHIMSGVTCGEFIFTGMFRGPDKGTLLFIAPKTYFESTGDLWDKSIQDHVAGVVPDFFEEVRPGIYKSKTRDWESVSRSLVNKGMTKSIRLQLAMNRKGI